MNFIYLVFELGDKTLTLSPMENLTVICNLVNILGLLMPPHGWSHLVANDATPWVGPSWTNWHDWQYLCKGVNIFFRNQILSGYVFSENRLLLVNVLCLECGVNRGEYGSAKTKSLKC